MRGRAGEAGLKRLAKGVDAAVSAVGRLLIQHVQPGLEAIALYLSEACGLARCSAWMAPLVLEVRSQLSSFLGGTVCLIRSCSWV